MLQHVARDDRLLGGLQARVLPVVAHLDDLPQERYTAPVDFASSVNLPAPEKTDSTLAAATFLQPTSAM